MEEPGRGAVRSTSDDEERVLVVQPEERVERHHETAFRLRAAPRARDLLELRPRRTVELARCEHLCLIAGALEAVNRLPHLADRPTVEREPRRLDHGLVTVVERV